MGRWWKGCRVVSRLGRYKESRGGRSVFRGDGSWRMQWPGTVSGLFFSIFGWVGNAPDAEEARGVGRALASLAGPSKVLAVLSRPGSCDVEPPVSAGKGTVRVGGERGALFPNEPLFWLQFLPVALVTLLQIDGFGWRF